MGKENRYLTEEYNKNIPENIKKVLEYCSLAADKNNIPIFLIGGIVRDIIINEKNFDVDVTVQGDAVNFARTVQEMFPEICSVKSVHECFKTAKIIFNINDELINIDLASTRKEVYPYPASLPVIEETGCELYEDVIRRDFSINSLALSLNKKSFCLLIDYLDGYNDLKKGIIRVLHHESFIDDPTRIIRGLKFSVRFSYSFESETEKLMEKTLCSGQFDNLSGERIKLELKQAFNINKAECLTRFLKENIYRLVDTSVFIPKNPEKIALDCQNFINKYEKFIDKNNLWLIYSGLLLTGYSNEKIKKLSKNLYLSGKEETILQSGIELEHNNEILKNAKTHFEIYEFFENTSPESILIFLIKNNDLKDKVDLYLRELMNTKISINGEALIKMGLDPGPLFSEIFRNILKAKINREIKSEQEELDFVKKFIE